jgi:CHRD domain
VATAVALGAVAAGALVTVAAAHDDDDSTQIKVRLTGYHEDPAAISTDAWGEFKMWVDGDREEISYRLEYADLAGAVTQAHIHFGGKAQSGGISAWLCDTTAAPAPSTVDPPTCPAEGSVSGTIEADDVVGPAAQGIDPGEFDELLDAIKAETTYVNVHSSKYPSGEIRSQLTFRDHR